jgi:transposase-like protein
MGETRRKFDRDFREGAVRLVRETGKPIAQVARDLGVNEGTLGNWVNADKRRRGEGNGALGDSEATEAADTAQLLINAGPFCSSVVKRICKRARAHAGPLEYPPSVLSACPRHGPG